MDTGLGQRQVGTDLPPDSEEERALVLAAAALRPAAPLDVAPTPDHPSCEERGVDLPPAKEAARFFVCGRGLASSRARLAASIFAFIRARCSWRGREQEEEEVFGETVRGRRGERESER